ncbi:MAG TPA: hypothetical protein VF002_02830 [Gaiellaceae bacterium]
MRVLAALLAGCLIALAIGIAQVSGARSSSSCGSERWAIKTMTDPMARLVDLQPRPTTVEALRRLRAPALLGARRNRPVETTTYRVRARLLGFKTEADSDIHLVIAGLHTAGTMIVEFPLRACVGQTPDGVRRKVSLARAALVRWCGTPDSGFAALTGRATITGVGFFDFLHGQTGVAPNGIELHPVLGFVGACKRPPPPPA